MDAAAAKGGDAAEVVKKRVGTKHFTSRAAVEALTSFGYEWPAELLASLAMHGCGMRLHLPEHGCATVHG